LLQCMWNVFWNHWIHPLKYMYVLYMLQQMTLEWIRTRRLSFFASDWPADRVDLTGLDNRKPLIEKDELLSIKLFLLNEEEIKLYKTSIKILLGRIKSCNIITKD
jgi:hypothetical protein